MARLMEAYADGHRHPTNAALHRICVPMIVLCVLAMLDWVATGVELNGHPATLGHAALLLAGAWYLWMWPRLALLLVPLSAGLLWLGALIPRPVVWALFVLAWGGQFLGHYVWEKQQPAFYTNLVQLLVGPAYFLARGLHWWPTRTAREGGERIE